MCAVHTHYCKINGASSHRRGVCKREVVGERESKYGSCSGHEVEH